MNFFKQWYSDLSARDIPMLAIFVWGIVWGIYLTFKPITASHQQIQSCVVGMCAAALGPFAGPLLIAASILAMLVLVPKGYRDREETV